MDSDGSTLRERHRVQTREALIDAFLELLEEGHDYQVSVAEIAKRADISLRTAYRYFADRQQLLEAAAERINTKVFPWIPMMSIHELPGVYAQLVELFERHPRLALVIHGSHRSGNIHGSVRVKRAQVLRTLIDDEFSHVDSSVRDKSYAGLLALDHVSTWVTLKEELNLSAEQIASSVGSAMALIIADLDQLESISSNSEGHDNSND